MSTQKEIVIIGAGVIGCSIAYHLAKRGAPSVIIERDSIGARASGKAWAVSTYPLRYLEMEGQPSNQLFSMPEGSMRPWLELFWSGYHRLPDLVLEIEEKGSINVGYGELVRIIVAISESEEWDCKEKLSLQRSQGYYETSWLEAEDLRALFPDINPRVRGGLAYPAFQVEPYRYTLGLAQAAEKMGARISQGEAVSFRHQGSKITSVVLSTGTEVKADVVVLAMGPWSGQGTSWLGKELPILVSREQCLRVEVLNRLPPYMMTCGVSIVPQVDGSVILGHAGIADPQPGFDSSLTEEAKVEILNDAIDLLPGLEEAKLIEHRGDLEGWTPAPNHIQPVLGLLPEWDNAYIAARLGTLGMTMSPGVGQVMADLIIAGGRIPYRIKTMMEALNPARL